MMIDFHYHYADVPGFIDDLLREMDEAQVEKTLLTTGPEDMYWEFKQCGMKNDEETLKAVREHPDRIVGNVYIDPTKPDAIDKYERFMEAGFRAVKMFPPVGYYPDEERFFPLYERIEKYGTPILFHMGQTNIKFVQKPGEPRRAMSSKFANPMNVDMLTRMFPGIPFVFAHNGYPFFLEAWSVAHANQNVYLDIAGSGPWTMGIPTVYTALGGVSFIPMDFKRVIWGSDNCMPQKESIAYAKVYLKHMGCSSEDRKLVLGETARRLLKL